ncbi:MAG: YbaB/EbfC family nucleoid-associated protein [Planctomycetes bacterium]|nr:YbaB/EbfC family nucleoid-associated protein [Planctomycetota bacterium]
MGSLLRQAQEMQRGLQRMQEELGQKRIEASAGGGVVTAVVSGQGELLRLSIRRDIVDPREVGALEDAVVAAVSAAQREAARVKQEQVERLTGGMVPPGYC